ncbi:hypothetical protein PV326_011891 [Microctonus aethiopoides]|nr:hypothetical protein PV326_011891 [Microctonus aethiopoides]
MSYLVLKPPGGGSSDIFGASADESPRRVKHHNQSQLGSALFGDGGASTGSSSPETPRANKPGNDSYKRLFGPPDPTTHNTKYHMRSNIALNGDKMNNITSMINGARINGGSALINGNANTNDNTDGNPVTGAGYISDQQNNSVASHNGSSSASINGDSKSTTDSSPMSTKQGRTRVPPGGFSSGLW